MKIRFLLTLVGLAITFALPTFAQQTNTPDPKLREQMLAFVTKFDPPFNNNDAAALAPFYTDDAVLVVPEGPVYGREAIVKFWTNLFQKVHFSNHLGTLDQLENGLKHFTRVAGAIKTSAGNVGDFCD